MGEDGDRFPRETALLRRGRPRNPIAAEQALENLERELFGVKTSPLSLSRYVLLRPIASGGAGLVYEAYDPELDRKVAVKLLRAATGGDDEVTEARMRLLREAQAMARIKHPNVIPVYDVGTYGGDGDDAHVAGADGERSIGRGVFVVMELVDGHDLGAWLADRDRGWREVLEVFIAAGRGLVAAHDSGLVHRDFKPGNVMVGDDGRVRVLDFGLARAAGESGLDEAHGDEDGGPAGGAGPSTRTTLLESPITVSGTVMGTPPYMAPEQHRGETVSERSDQFSYCTALYEALHGHRPFRGQSLRELRVAKESGDVRAGGKDVPAWVQRCVMRGLAPDPADRYPSMRVLLEALEDDPIRRRRRWLLGVGVAAALAAGIGVGAGAVERRDALCADAESHLAGIWDDAARDGLRTALSGAGKSYAADTAARVVRRLDQHTRAWVDMRVEACEATHRRGEQSEALLDLRMTCLDRRLHETATLVRVLGEPDPAMLERSIGAVDDLVPIARCADVETLQRGQERALDPSLAGSVASVRGELAQAKALYDAGRYTDGIELARAVAARARELGHPPLLAEALVRLAAFQVSTGAHEDGHATLLEAATVAEGAGADEIALRAHGDIVTVLAARLARLDEASSWSGLLRAKLERLRTPAALESRVYEDLGVLADKRGDYALAQEHFERVVALHEHAPESTHYGKALGNLAGVVTRRGDHARARALHERTVAALERALGPEHPTVAKAHNNLGNMLHDVGEYAAAAEAYGRALEIWRGAVHPEHEFIGMVHNNLGNVANSRGRFGDAEHHHRRALEIYESALGPEHRRVADALNNLGNVMFDQGKDEDARGYYRRSLDVMTKAVGEDHPRIALVLVNLGNAEVALGDPKAALGRHRRALALWERALGPEHPSLGYPLTGEGWALLELGRPADAIAPLTRALPLGKGSKDPRPTAETRFALARALWQTAGDRERALALAREARDGFAKAPADGRDRRGEVERWLASRP